ncbi:MAG: hypothetical protein GYA14_01155 [Ignavibacteria bacterium]|nr:hypothetical protein [Ignavibacteria bacterium]
MGIKPTIEYRENILVLRLKGARTLYDHDEINSLIISELQKFEHKKAVIDFIGVKGKRSIVESIQTADSFPLDFRQYKIAIIESTDNREAAVAEESVFKNRGFILRAFFDLDDGINWLQSLNNE